MWRNPRPGPVAAALVCAAVVPASACSIQDEPQTTAAAAASTSAPATLQVSEARPIVLRDDHQQVVRLAGDEARTLEMVVRPGDVAAGSTVRAVATSDSLPADAPYSSFTGPLTVELSARSARPVVLRARAESPEAVPVLWRHEPSGWVARAVGVPGDFAASREQETGVFDAGGYLPSVWGATAGARVSARARLVVNPPVCATKAPDWLAAPESTGALAACFGQVQNDQGEALLQVRLVNTRGLAVAVRLPAGAVGTQVDGQAQAVTTAQQSLVGSQGTALLGPGQQLTFAVPAGGRTGNVEVSASVTATTLLADVAAAGLEALGQASPGEAWAAAAPLAARCVASDPGAVAALPTGEQALARRIDAMAVCVARAVAGPASRAQAGVELTAARLGRTPQEVSTDKGLAGALARDRGLVGLLGEIGTRAGGLGSGSAQVARMAAQGAGATVTARVEPSRVLCAQDEDGCTIFPGRGDVDGDGRPDLLALARGKGEGGRSRYEVRVQTAAGTRSAQPFDADAGVGAAAISGTAAVDGVQGQEVLVRLGTPGGGSAYLVLTFRDGLLQAMPLPGKDGQDQQLQVQSGGDVVVGWTAGTKDGGSALMRETWQNDGARWKGRFETWTWSGAGWTPSTSGDLGERSEAAARQRGRLHGIGGAAR